MLKVSQLSRSLLLVFLKKSDKYFKDFGCWCLGPRIHLQFLGVTELSKRCVSYIVQKIDPKNHPHIPRRENQKLAQAFIGGESRYFQIPIKLFHIPATFFRFQAHFNEYNYSSRQNLPCQHHVKCV